MSSKPTPKPRPKTSPASKPDLVAAAAVPATELPRVDSTDRAVALKLRALVGRVVEATGGKKKGVKEIVEATLTALGAALARGEELNLPGVGKVRVAKSVDREGRSMMTLKVRGIGTPKAKEALAEAEEAV